MDKHLKNLMSNLKYPELPEKLFSKIMTRIHKEQKLSTIRTRLIIFSVTFISSIIALLPTTQALITSFKESGFMEFLSLIISDIEIVFNNWQDYSITLLESLPVTNIAILLTILFISLKSMQYIAINAKKVLHISLITKHN